MEQKNLSIPLAIVIAGVLIAGAVIYKKPAPAVETKNTGVTAEEQISFRPIDENDHRLGNPNALISLIEYSDLECPACQFFHPTMKKLIDEYGKVGKLAWIYRHAPLLNIHPKAQKEAEATECAYELGGNSSFWQYVDMVFKVSPANNGLDPARLPAIAKDIGLNREKFEACLSSGKYATKVQDDYNDSLSAGLAGTPHNLLVLKRPLNQINADAFKKQYGTSGIKLTENRQTVVLPGAYPYEAMKKLVEDILVLSN